MTRTKTQSGSEQKSKLPELPQGAPAARCRRRLLVLAGLLLLGAGILLWFFYLYGVAAPKPHVLQAVAPAPPSRGTLAPPAVPFREAARRMGIDFHHTNGAQGRRLLPETMGSGAGFIDFDGDGDQDLVFANGIHWKGAGGRQEEPTQAFYRNEDGHFRNVTSEVGLDRSFYGMGVAVGDYDGDGRPDLYFTAVGPNHLFHNVAGRRFEEVTEQAGVGGGAHWSTGAVFVDYDRDGDLDLFCVNYIAWSARIDLAQDFTLGSLVRAYGPPTGFQGDQPFLFQNQGQGRFREVAQKAGLQRVNPATGVPLGKSLGVVVCDFNEDGWPDLLVSNDTVQNFAFQNRHDGTFQDVGLDTGFAFDVQGHARGAMGISVARYRNDESLAVAVGNFANEMTAFYVNQTPKNPLFVDDATSVGLGADTRDSLTFGLSFGDLDLDGYQDVVAANGHVEPEISRVQKSQHYAQPLEIFWNASGKGGSRFVRLGKKSLGEEILRPFVGRGLALGDVDGDGDLDILATENGGRPRLFLNLGPPGHALRLDLRDAQGLRVMVGARVRLMSSAGTQDQTLGSGGSYLSANELILTFGLGQDQEARDIQILWPDGKRQGLPSLEAGYHLIREAP